MTSAPSGFISNRMGRILLDSAEEIIGPSALRSILDEKGLALSEPFRPPADPTRALPIEIVSALHSALETHYDPQGAHGLALLIGRACFKYGMRLLSEPLGFNTTAFRLLPYSRKIHNATQAVAKLLLTESDLRLSLNEANGKLFFRLEGCPICHTRATSEPACHLVVGLLQESLGWLSGGKMFDVKETLCLARGDNACTFEIDLNPIN